MIVVADTSPINYLVLIKEIEILPRLYGKVVIPQTVRDRIEMACFGQLWQLFVQQNVQRQEFVQQDFPLPRPAC